MTQATTTRRGFACRCPFCGEPDTLQVCVHDVAALICSSCEELVTIDDLRKTIGQWQALLAWLDTAPEIGGTDVT